MDPDRESVHSAPTCAVGFWSAGTLTATGVLYFIVIVGYFLAHGIAMPPGAAVQFFGGVVSIVDAAVLLMLMTSIHEATAKHLQVLSRIAVVFTTLFCAAVSTNRFVQLSIVRQRISSGDTAGIGWFLPYGPHSAMFSLEILGWGFFLGIACLFAAPTFSGGKLEIAIRWLFLSYGVLGLVTAIAFVLESPIAAVGFLAWGAVLPTATGLLAAFFRHLHQQRDSGAAGAQLRIK